MNIFKSKPFDNLISKLNCEHWFLFVLLYQTSFIIVLFLFTYLAASLSSVRAPPIRNQAWHFIDLLFLSSMRWFNYALFSWFQRLILPPGIHDFLYHTIAATSTTVPFDHPRTSTILSLDLSRPRPSLTSNIPNLDHPRPRPFVLREVSF